MREVFRYLVWYWNHFCHVRSLSEEFPSHDAALDAMYARVDELRNLGVSVEDWTVLSESVPKDCEVIGRQSEVYEKS